MYRTYHGNPLLIPHGPDVFPLECLQTLGIQIVGLGSQFGHNGALHVVWNGQLACKKLGLKPTTHHVGLYGQTSPELGPAWAATRRLKCQDSNLEWDPAGSTASPSISSSWISLQLATRKLLKRGFKNVIRRYLQQLGSQFETVVILHALFGSDRAL